jgi:hypothetical protein
MPAKPWHIGNTADTYGQTWHLPDDNRLTYKQFITEIDSNWARNKLQSFTGRPQNRFFFNHNLKETQELLPRYAIDNIFKSSKFKTRFPDFVVTTYPEGIKMIIKDFNIK